MDWLNIVLIVGVIAAAGWAIYERSKRGETVTLPTIVGELEAAVPFAQELATVAEMAAFEVEEYRRKMEKGEVPVITNEEAFERAFQIVKGWFPEQTKGLTTQKIIGALNRAILLASEVSNAIKASKAQQAGVTVINGPASS